MTTSEPVRWGILGTGGINRRFLGGMAQAEAARIVAVASRDADRGAAFAAEHGIPSVHGAYEALLADREIEAVYISLPNSLHHPWSMAALAAGKHVLSEKPYTRRPAEVDEGFDAAERAGRLLVEGFMWRYTPQTERLVRGEPPRSVRSGRSAPRSASASTTRRTSVSARRSRAAR